MSRPVNAKLAFFTKIAFRYPVPSINMPKVNLLKYFLQKKLTNTLIYQHNTNFKDTIWLLFNKPISEDL